MPAITEQDVLSALRSCYDPEIPVNIVDLGLIYKVDFREGGVVPRQRHDTHPIVEPREVPSSRWTFGGLRNKLVERTWCPIRHVTLLRTP